MNTIIVNIDSRFRDINKYKNSGKFSIPVGDRIKNVKSIKMVSFEFPRLINFLILYNTISNEIKDNSNFKIIINDIIYIITVKNGHYAKEVLIDNINNLIQLQHLGLLLSIIDDKVVISSTSLIIFSLDFTNDELYPSLGKNLGFSENIYTNITYLESDMQINIPTDNYLFIKINDYGAIHTISNNLLNNKTYLSKVTLNNSADNVFISRAYKFSNPINIDKLDIELLNPYFNNINLNNINYSFTLELEI